ncbi:hypothetical protein Vretimale_2628 [Volvox reticuliferus]|uniref:Uncharacterized protein n=1 Tax=Volvox reticuliferus TaxID=1737510 RepID=A0A8J4C4S5_9CHLO|nr:hypothetical protein Vretifemale_1884 [Volvox reticuliferus]GIL96891.1 hypothetical protein Vretimale_2628 [Volvox reticuliferus]
MQALAQPVRLSSKPPLQSKAGAARHGKPFLSVPRGAVQSQAVAGVSGSAILLYQIADAEVAAPPPVVLDAVVDAPPPAVLDAAAAATEALSSSSAAADPNVVAVAVEAVAETVSEAAAAAISAAADAVTNAADTAAETVSSAAAAASDAVVDAMSAVSSAVAPPAEAPATTQTQTLSLAAQRYAEMTSKAPKIAPGGGGGSSGGASFQAPSFSMPDLSGIQLPKFTAPDLSNLSAPDFSKLSVPDFPKLPVAAGEAGDVGISMPNIDFTKLELPAAPAFDVPDIGGAAASVSSGAAAAASRVAAAASGALSGVTAAAGGAASSASAAINGATGGLLEELNQELSSIRSAVQSAASSAESAVGSTVSSLEASIGDAAGQVYNALPPQAQLVARDMGDVVYAFASHPTSSLVLAGLVGVPLAIKSYADRYGGYNGDLSPQTVKELLNKEDVLVVDVRTEAERQDSGVLDLRKGARFNAAALPVDLVTFSPKWARESKAGERLGSTTIALLISRLNRIRTPLTKIVIMNNNDDLAARELARAVRAAGVLRVYVMAGGFQAWSAAGLGVASGKTDYEASALVVLLDEIAEVAAVVGPKLREPAFLATTLATSSLVVYAAVNYHTTLRYFAVWGIFATIYWRLSQYNSPQEFLEDLKSGARTAASSAAGAVSAAARTAASATTSKPPALATVAAAPALPAAAAAAPPPSPVIPAVPPPPPTEASAAALAAAMAAAGMAPLPPVAAPTTTTEGLAATNTVSAPSVTAPATDSVVPAEDPLLPVAPAALSDTTSSTPLVAAAIAASAAAPPVPVSPKMNGNGKAAKLEGPAPSAADDAKVAVSVVTAEAATPASGESSSSE